MKDFSKGKIYKIISNTSDKIYIGSTIQLLCKRMEGHRTKNNKCSSSLLGDIKDIYIILICNYSCNNKEELRMEEERQFQLYKKNGFDVVNKRSPYTTKEQKKEQHEKWKEDNKEKIKETSKKYKEVNRDKICERMKIYNNTPQRKEQKKIYMEKNKEQLNKKRKEYDLKPEVKKKRKEYIELNKEHLKEKQKKWKEEHKEQNKETQKKWEDNNKEKIKETHKKYREEHKEQRKIYDKERNTKKITCICGSIICIKGQNRHEKSEKHIKYINESA